METERSLTWEETDAFSHELLASVDRLSTAGVRSILIHGIGKDGTLYAVQSFDTERADEDAMRRLNEAATAAFDAELAKLRAEGIDPTK